MLIHFEVSPPDVPCGIKVVAENGEDRISQTDYDYPGFASLFGWTPCKKCNSTDGTIDCGHRTASDMIHEAYKVLLKHEKEQVEDPGYFS